MRAGIRDDGHHADRRSRAYSVRRHKACEVLGISCRALRRWCTTEYLSNGRKGARRECLQVLTEAHHKAVVGVCDQPKSSPSPLQIMPVLADRGRYLASESTFYRILREHDQDHRRSLVKPSRTVAEPKAWAATDSNQVWSWDITCRLVATRRQFYRRHLVMDIYSRLAGGREVHTKIYRRTQPASSARPVCGIASPAANSHCTPTTTTTEEHDDADNAAKVDLPSFQPPSKAKAGRQRSRIQSPRSLLLRSPSRKTLCHPRTTCSQSLNPPMLATRAYDARDPVASRNGPIVPYAD